MPEEQECPLGPSVFVHIFKDHSRDLDRGGAPLKSRRAHHSSDQGMTLSASTVDRHDEGVSFRMVGSTLARVRNFLPSQARRWSTDARRPQADRFDLRACVASGKERR